MAHGTRYLCLIHIDSSLYLLLKSSGWLISGRLSDHFGHTAILRAADNDISKVRDACLSVRATSFFIAENLYAVEVIVIKVSLCCFFLRIFPQKQFRICCYALVILMSTLAVAWVLLLIFQCKPITSNWNINIEHPRCYNIQIYAYAGAVAAMSQDMCILALPIPLVLKLSISTRKKIGVIAMFSLGISVTIISAVRTQFIYYFGTSSDPSWDNVDITIWTSMEISAGLVCCNMPACARLIAHLHREYIYPRRLSIEETHKPFVSKISSQSLEDGKGSMQSRYQSSSSRQSPEHPVPMQSHIQDLNFELDIESGIPKTEVDLRLAAKMVAMNEPIIPVTKLCGRGVKLSQEDYHCPMKPQTCEKNEDVGPRFDRMMQIARKCPAEIELPPPAILGPGITVRKEFTIEEILIENIKIKMRRGNLAAPKLYGERAPILIQQGNLRQNQHSTCAETPKKQVPIHNFWEKPSHRSFDNP
ncbi:PTH11/CFEM domain protein [Blumeria hordei DH14]|uniref:PTH11/CFEM domain protein n=1 Tax=Blumeria graminis f. sp. hordei (strain DH14) TaxID=546991 RepID=N1JJU1_BLUG1|nr:PTH11/CFEM domain protein [Blumeria hordei DH14]